MLFFNSIKATFVKSEEPMSRKQYPFDFSKVNTILFDACQDEKNYGACNELASITKLSTLSLAQNVASNFETIMENSKISTPVMASTMARYMHLIEPSSFYADIAAKAGRNGIYSNFKSFPHLQNACIDSRNTRSCDKLDSLYSLLEMKLPGINTILESFDEVKNDINESIQSIGINQSWPRERIVVLEKAIAIQILESCIENLDTL